MSIFSFISTKLKFFRHDENKDLERITDEPGVHEDGVHEVEECSEIKNPDAPAMCKNMKAYAMASFIKKSGPICKFAQSEPGLSIESSFKEYRIGKVSEDSVNWLSVTTEDYALACIGYGDLFVKFEDDPEILRENGMFDQPIIDINNPFGELKTKRLLPKSIRSLNEPELLVDLIKKSKIRPLEDLIVRNGKGEIEDLLRSIRCEKTADFLCFLRERHFPDLNHFTDTYRPACEIKENIVFDCIDWYNELNEVQSYRSDFKTDHGTSDSADLFVIGNRKPESHMLGDMPDHERNEDKTAEREDELEL